MGGWTYGLLEEFPALIPSLIGCALALVAVVLFLVVHPAFSKPEPKVRRQEELREELRS